MKRIDLAKEHHSLSEVLTYAKTETVFISSTSGETFVLESAGGFDQEVAALGSSEEFMSFLNTRSKEAGDISLQQVRRKRSV